MKRSENNQPTVMSVNLDAPMIASHQTTFETATMNNDQPSLDLDRATVILGLVYASCYVIVIGWLAALAA